MGEIVSASFHMEIREIFFMGFIRAEYFATLVRTSTLSTQERSQLNTFEQDCEEVISNLKASFIDLYSSLGADPHKPQDVSRHYKLNKTLTWKIARFMQSGGGLESVPHIPGVSAIEKLLKVSSDHGASTQTVKVVRDATKRFEQMIEVHVGDRATLDMIADGLSSNRNGKFEISRKRAYMGNSGISGVQANTHLKSFYFAPNAANPEMVDVVVVRGYTGLRRIRADVTFPLFNLRQVEDTGERDAPGQWAPLVKGSPSPFLEAFSPPDLSEIQPIDSDDGYRWIVYQPGPIGNSRSFDCFYADRAYAGAPRYWTDDNPICELSQLSMVPTERVVMDVIAHKDMAEILKSNASVYSYNFSKREREGVWSEAFRLPMDLEPVKLAGAPPAIATPDVTRYPELSQLVYDQMDWNPADFIGIRLILSYPPLGSTVVMRFELPKLGS